VDGGDRSLDPVLAQRLLPHRAVEERDPLGDPRLIPERAVLLGERDELAARVGARGPACVDEEHEREEAGDLAVVG